MSANKRAARRWSRVREDRLANRAVERALNDMYFIFESSRGVRELNEYLIELGQREKRAWARR